MTIDQMNPGSCFIYKIGNKPAILVKLKNNFILNLNNTEIYSAVSEKWLQELIEDKECFQVCGKICINSSL